MFGYACSETPELMPLPIMLAHKLTKRMAEVRKADVLPYLRPDGKSQVTVRYEGQRPVEIVRVVLATQHAPEADVDTLIKPDLLEHVVEPILPKELYDAAALAEITLVNPTGRFVVGGPMGDTGLTGRKLVVDTYGGAARHGGGAFSGKDPSKVDRSGAYAARYVAKNVVAAGLCEICEVQVAYAIGVAHPVSVMIDCHGTETISVESIEALVREHFDLRPAAIIRDLDLRRPIYRKTSTYGHFGRYRPRFHLGAHRQGRRAARGGRPEARSRAGRRLGARVSLMDRPGGPLAPCRRVGPSSQTDGLARHASGCTGSPCSAHAGVVASPSPPTSRLRAGD